jgi:hypothetical protein
MLPYFTALESSYFYVGEQSRRIVVRCRTFSTLQLGPLVLGGAPRVVWHLGRFVFLVAKTLNEALLGLCALRWHPKSRPNHSPSEFVR